MFVCLFVFSYHTNASERFDKDEYFLSKSFCCCSLTKSHTDDIERWIRSLGKLGVEELVLDFRCFTRIIDLSFSYSVSAGVSHGYERSGVSGPHGMSLAAEESGTLWIYCDRKRGGICYVHVDKCSWFRANAH